MRFDPCDHFWLVNGDTAQVFSSSLALSGREPYAPTTDERYLQWVEMGGRASPIDSVASIWAIVATEAPQAVPEAYRPVPTITKAQCLLWLLQQGKSESDIDALIAAIPDAEQRAVAEIEWRYRQPFHYDHPLFTILAPEIGVSVEELPAAFRAAAAL